MWQMQGAAPPLRTAMAGVLLAATLACSAASAGQAADFQRALQAYERNHWASAYAGFAALADEGHAPSARLALLMQRFGPRLYATRFEASPPRRQQWLQAAVSDSEVARLAATPSQALP